MGNIQDEITFFRESGIKLFLDGGKLRYVSGKQPTAAEIERLKERKSEIVEFLRKRKEENLYQEIMDILIGGVNPFLTRPTVKITLEKLCEYLDRDTTTVAVAVCELELYGAVVIEYDHDGSEFIRYGYDWFYQNEPIGGDACPKFTKVKKQLCKSEVESDSVTGAGAAKRNELEFFESKNLESARHC